MYQRGCGGNFMSNFNADIAMCLSRSYGIAGALSEIETRIQKYTTINTPEGEKWMVKYRSEWYLLDLD
jgi:hypothetical protein